jgi:6-phosphogluconolactonase
VRLVEYPDREALALAVADRLAADLRSALVGNDRVSLAVPGGTTPGPVFDLLSAAALDWARVAVVPTDERCVPPDHPRSNARLIRDRLLTGRAAAARFVPLAAAGDDARAELAARAAEVAALLPLSVLLLGMGEDGHIASLFPGADRLAEALAPAAPPVLALAAPAAPEPRITLTAPVLAGALVAHLAITGEGKRAALERARGLPPEAAPVRIVLGTATVHWAP